MRPPNADNQLPPLIIRPPLAQLIIRIVFLCLFVIGAWALIRVNPGLRPAAYAFVVLPLLFLLDALLAFRTKLVINSEGIMQIHYRKSWHCRWNEIATWSVHEMSSDGPNLIAIDLHLNDGGRRQRLTTALVRYKDANYRKVRDALLHYLGPPSA
jgi:hypothetical protein